LKPRLQDDLTRGGTSQICYFQVRPRHKSAKVSVILRHTADCAPEISVASTTQWPPNNEWRQRSMAQQYSLPGAPRHSTKTQRPSYCSPGSTTSKATSNCIQNDATAAPLSLRIRSKHSKPCLTDHRCVQSPHSYPQSFADPCANGTQVSRANPEVKPTQILTLSISST